MKVRGAVLGIVAGSAVYLGVLRPRMLSWGANRSEARSVLPGEDSVPTARVRSTRAITIGAPAERVWPWLNQIGQDRGGLYSSTLLENLAGLRFTNAEAIHDDWQLQVGDLVRFVPPDKGDFGLTVLRSEPPHLLVLGGGGAAPGPGQPQAVWIFRLKDEAGGTRLIARFRSDYVPGLWADLGNKWLLEPVHFLMERSMLNGLRERAQR